MTKSRSEPQRVTRRIDELIIEAPWWCRAKIDPDHVARLSEAMELGFGNIPEIIIDSNNRIVDGVHRYEALRQKGVQEVECILAEDEGEAWAISVSENCTHGLPYSLAERRTHFVKAWKAGVWKGWKRDEIADLYQVSTRTIHRWISELEGTKEVSRRAPVQDKPTEVPKEVKPRPEPVVERVTQPPVSVEATKQPEATVRPQVANVAFLLLDLLAQFIHESITPEEVIAVWRDKEQSERVVQILRHAHEKLRTTYERYLDTL